MLSRRNDSIVSISKCQSELTVYLPRRTKQKVRGHYLPAEDTRCGNQLGGHNMARHLMIRGCGLCVEIRLPDVIL